MIKIILRIFTALNALIGLALVAAAVWPSQDPTIEKKPIIVVIYLIWAVLFFGLSSAVFNLKPIARKWTIGLYGFASVGTLWGFVSDVINHDKILAVFPWVSISVYVLFLAFFISPMVFMLRPDMKDYFTAAQQARREAEEEAARASMRR